MPEFKAGRAYIEVAPSLKGFRRKAESDLNSELSGAGTAAGEKLGQNIADGAERGAASGGRRSADKFAGEFDKQVRTRLNAALKSLPDAEIGADSSDAEKKIQELRARLVELSSKKIGIDVDGAEAIAQIDAIRSEMNAIDGDTLKIDARINTAAAMAELEKLAVKSAEVDANDINIDANVDTAGAHANLSALEAHAASTAVSISSIALAIGALGPALIPLAAGGAVALAGIGGAAAGAAAGVGVLAVALAPVVGAVQALGAADAASGQASATAAKAREAAAQRTESAAQRVQDAARAVSDAEEASAQRVTDAQERVAQVREQVADKAKSAARAVSDAQERLATVQEQSASRVQSALRSVGDAEERLAQTQKDSLAAQQAVTAAREDAKRALEDLSMNLADAQLRERAAEMALADAQETLKRTMANPRASQQERDKAQLAYDQAKQTLTETQVQVARLTAEKTDADKKGVEGSDAVVKAQDAAKAAAGNVAGAERDLADARAAAVKAQQDGARDIGRATRDMADAEAAQVKAQRDGARDIAKAVRDVSRAQEAGAKQVAAAQLSLTRAQDAYRDSLKSTGSEGPAALDKVKQAMANLSPTGQAFALWVYSLKDGLVGLSKIAQDNFLPGLMDGMKSLSVYSGLLKTFVKDVATVLGDLARDAGKALSGPFWQQFFKFLAAKTPGWLDTLGRVLGAAATGAAALFQAFSPLIDAMGKGTLDLFDRFAEWAQGLGKDKGFQSFLAYLKETGPKVAAFLGALAGALTNVVVALAPYGSGVLDVLTGALNWIASLDPNTIAAIATTVLAVAAGLKAVSVAQGLVNAVMALGPWGWVAVAIGAVAGALVYLYQTNDDFRKQMDVIWADIQKIFGDAVAAIQQFWKDHGAQIMAEWDSIWGTIQDTFSSVWTSIHDIAVSVGGWLQTFWAEWGGRLTTFFSTMWGTVKQIFNGTMQTLRGIFETFAGLFTGDWGRMWNGLKDVFSGAWKIFTGVLKAATDGTQLALELAWAAIWSVAEKAWNGIVDGIGAIWDKLVDGIRGPVDSVMEFLQKNLIDRINGLFDALSIKLHIDPIWKPSNVGTGMVHAGHAYTGKGAGYREGGYTGNKGVNAVAGVVHGREFVFDAATTAMGGGPGAMEGIRRAIKSGWKPAGYKAGGYVNPVGRAPAFPWGRYPSGGRHPAFDYPVPIGTPVRSPYSGVVLRDGWDTTGYGTSIRGRSDDGVFFVLGHLMRELVSVGQHLTAGQLVGYSGYSGNVHPAGPRGAHLHFGTSHTANMVGPGAFNPDTGGGGQIGGTSAGNMVQDVLATTIAASIGSFTSSVSSGLSSFGFFGQLLGGAVKAIGTGATNLGIRMLGLDSGGSGGPYSGASDPGARSVKPLLFDSGGYLPTGISVVKNATGRPEPLLRLDAPGRGAPGAGDTWNVYGIGEEAIQRALRQKEFRDMTRSLV